MREKALKYRNWEDAHAYLLGKLLLKKGLEDFGFCNDMEEVRVNLFNRPYINQNIDFNISHSGQYVVCAFSLTNRVGIDIERIDSVEIGDFKSQLSSNEWERIVRSKESCKEFYRLWTIKEAVVKADGRGLSIPLKNIEVKNKEAYCEGTCWNVSKIFICGRYICHLATQSPGLEYTLQEVDINNYLRINKN